MQVCVRKPGVQVSTSTASYKGCVTWKLCTKTDTSGKAMKSSIITTDGPTKAEKVVNFMVLSLPLPDQSTSPASRAATR